VARIDNPQIDIDIFLKVTNDETRNAYEIIEEHIKVTEKNPNGYTWWGNNQPFSPSKLNEFKRYGHNPKALLFIPRTAGGSGNIEFVADILDSVKFDNKGFPDDQWRPQYYFNVPHKVFLKLANFRRVNPDSSTFDVNNYFVLSNDSPVKEKLSTQYACGYVYKMKVHNISNNQLDSDTQEARGFLEGKRRLVQHITIERNSRLIKEAKENFKRIHGRLFCEVCNLDFEKVYGELGQDYIEGHHKVPLSQLTSETESTIDDIALLCSNCHSMIHRKKECLSVEELRQIVEERRRLSSV
jgi:hypothetical protein